MDAVRNLTEGSFSVKTDGEVTYADDCITIPTEAKINTEIARLQTEYDAQEYARNRASAYDSVGDQLDQLMKDMRDGTTTHKDACEAVKAKYPKPE